MPPQQKPGRPAVYEWSNEYYRSTYDKQGNLLSAPERINTLKVEEPSIDVVLPEELTGFIIKHGSGFLVIPEWYRKHKGKPFFVSVRDGKYNKEPIEWGTKKIDIIHSVISTERHVVLLVTQVGEKDFEFVAIDKETKKIEAFHSVGVPRRIYDFPRSSNLLLYNGKVLVAWVEEYVDGFHLNLSSWDLYKNLLAKKSLPAEIDWNTSLSMARIDDVLLLAYHYGPKQLSVIKVMKIDLAKSSGHRR